MFDPVNAGDEKGYGRGGLFVYLQIWRLQQQYFQHSPCNGYPYQGEGVHSQTSLFILLVRKKRDLHPIVNIWPPPPLKNNIFLYVLIYRKKQQKDSFESLKNNEEKVIGGIVVWSEKKISTEKIHNFNN